MTNADPTTPVPALRVRQWLGQWDTLTYNESQNQARPKEHFYLFSLPASQLRKLSGIYRRSTEAIAPRKDDLGIQRKHDPERSEEIRRYVEGGYPWSGLSDAKRRNPENDSLRKPGWLPTAVVVNILTEGDTRSGQTVAAADIITVQDDEETNIALLHLPTSQNDSVNQLPPVEVIDGQHRLFAFDDDDPTIEDYYLPVVAFHGLDISWQAYLFWTINIKPKKINPSLAFDLYPLLREQEWLESGEVVHVYRESRAQELTEILWSSPSSPWYRRINMLGGARKENGPVTQAAFIRSLMSSMVKSWKSHKGPGGIFGGTPDSNDGLSWSRLQQSAFLLTAWTLFAESVKDTREPWAQLLREQDAEIDDFQSMRETYHDPAFTGPNTLLATDQGVRGFQYIINDLCFIRHRELHLADWKDLSDFAEITPEHVAEAAQTLRNQPVFNFLHSICITLSSFDWRSSGAFGVDDPKRLTKAALRGSGGYKELRLQLAAHLRESDFPEVANAATYLGS